LSEILLNKKEQYKILSKEFFHTSQDFMRKSNHLKHLKIETSQYMTEYIECMSKLAILDSELAIQKEIAKVKSSSLSAQRSEINDEINNCRDELEIALNTYMECRKSVKNYQHFMEDITEDNRIKSLNISAFCKYSQSLTVNEVRKISNKTSWPTNKQINEQKHSIDQHVIESETELKKFFYDKIVDFRIHNNVLRGRQKEIFDTLGLKQITCKTGNESENNLNASEHKGSQNMVLSTTNYRSKENSSGYNNYYDDNDTKNSYFNASYNFLPHIENNNTQIENNKSSSVENKQRSPRGTSSQHSFHSFSILENSHKQTTKHNNNSRSSTYNNNDNSSVHFRFGDNYLEALSSRHVDAKRTNSSSFRVINDTLQSFEKNHKIENLQKKMTPMPPPKKTLMFTTPLLPTKNDALMQPMHSTTATTVLSLKTKPSSSFHRNNVVYTPSSTTTNVQVQNNDVIFAVPQTSTIKPLLFLNNNNDNNDNFKNNVEEEEKTTFINEQQNNHKDFVNNNNNNNNSLIIDKKNKKNVIETPLFVSKKTKKSIDAIFERSKHNNTQQQQFIVDSLHDVQSSLYSTKQLSENDARFADVVVETSRLEGVYKQLSSIKEGLDVQLHKQAYMLLLLTHELHQSFDIDEPSVTHLLKKMQKTTKLQSRLCRFQTKKK